MRPGSDFSFGVVFVVFFVLVASWPIAFGEPPRVWAFLVAFFLLLPTLLAPWALRPFNLLWFRFGRLLHALVSPIILWLIFAVVVVPIGLLMRLFGKDVLDIDTRRAPRKSYWILREKRTIAPNSLRKQF